MTTYYLYVKTHNVTGLKYLGKTIRSDYHAYAGSGTRWLHHLNKHGFNYSTKIIYQTNSYDLLRYIGIIMSHHWDIVKSNDWANLKEEAGDGGRMGAEACQKISKSRKGIKFSDEHLRNLRIARAGRTFSEDTRRKMSASSKGRAKSDEHRKNISRARQGDKNPMFGNQHSEETRKKMSEASKGKPKSAEHCKNISKAKRGDN